MGPRTASSKSASTVPLASSACLPCFVKRKACDRTYPKCGRCVKTQDPRMECSYRTSQKGNPLNDPAHTHTNTAIANTKWATREQFLNERRKWTKGPKRVVACGHCRANKKACEGLVEGGCQRCRTRGLACVPVGSDEKSSDELEDSNGDDAAPASASGSNSNTASASNKNTASSSLPAPSPSRYPSTDSLEQQEESPPETSTDESDSNSNSSINMSSSVASTAKELGQVASSNKRRKSHTSSSFWQNANADLVRAKSSSSGSVEFIVSTDGVIASSTYSTLSRGTSATLPSGSLVPNIITIAHQPTSPSSWLPESTAIFQCIDAYFAGSNLIATMLHKGGFQASRNNPDLLVCSVLLLAPYSNREVVVVGRSTPSAIKTWDRVLFHRAKAELLAVLSGSAVPVSIETAAAVVNLAVWALYKGLQILSRQLVVLSKRLLQVLGLVEDVETMKPPERQPSWTEVMMNSFGPDIQTRVLAPSELAYLRNLWIDYYVRERVAALVLYLHWLERHWMPAVTGASFPLDNGYPELKRWTGPMPLTWDESNSDLFDPRLTRQGVMYSDVVAPLLMDAQDPRRSEAFEKMGGYVVSENHAIFRVFYLLRNKVDRFLKACVESGFESPGLLPLDNENEAAAGHAHDERTIPLCKMRRELDETIQRTRNSFPEMIKQGLAQGSARKIVQCLYETTGGDFTYAFNNVTFFAAIGLLRLELYSSCGVYRTAKALSEASASEDQISWADEFGSGGPLFAQLLADVLLFTRLAEEWHSLNPRFHRHVEGNNFLFFRMCCLHTSFYKKFQRSLGVTDVPGVVDALAQIARDMQVCLDVLKSYGQISPYNAGMYSLALKVVSDQKFSRVDTTVLSRNADATTGVKVATPPEVAARGGEDDELVVEEARQLQSLLGVYRSLAG